MDRRDALKAFLGVPLITQMAAIAPERVTPRTVIVIECPGLLSDAQVSNIKALTHVVWPDQKVVVLTEGMTLRLVDA